MWITNDPTLDRKRSACGVFRYEPRISAPCGFWLVKRGARLHCFSSKEWGELGKKLILISGGHCLGKSRLARALDKVGIRLEAEAKTRRYRPGEERGREMISLSPVRFWSLLEQRRFVLAYTANQDERGQWVGILKGTLEVVLSRANPSCLIVHPVAARILSLRSGCPIVMPWADKEDWIRFRMMRHHVPPLSFDRRFDRVVLPENNTVFVQNRFNHFDQVVKEVLDSLRKKGAL